jgi:sulfite exporter TauE/SafE
MVWVGTALLLGLASSLHCVGMCGPISLALTAKSPKLLQHNLIYHFGRIITYTALGVLFGFFGRELFLFGFQQNVAVYAGIALLLYAVFPVVFRRLSFQHPLLRPIYGKWFKFSQRIMQGNGVRRSFSMGMLNGILPCGMVYAALAGALATQGILQGAGFMFLFGMGTSPLLTGFVMSQQLAKQEWRERFRAYLPVFLSIAAVLMILRGADLDWGSFSPSMIANQVFIAVCS